MHTYSRHRRDYAAGLVASARWIRNPVSEDGAKQVFRIIYAVLGPDVHRMLNRMRARPEFQRLLLNRPDLGAALTDLEPLGQLPEGTVGRTYHAFMSWEDAFPGYLLAGLAYKDGHFDRLVDWDDDAKWLLERGSFTHDITHVIAGYGTDFAGESLLIPFSMTSVGVPRAVGVAYATQWALLSYPAIAPPVSLQTWVALMVDSADRGADLAAQMPFFMLPLEEWLPLPLAEARRRAGLRPHRHTAWVNAEGFLDTREWNRGWLGKQMESGFGTLPTTMANVRRGRALVERGVPLKLLMSARKRNAERAHALFEQGAPMEDVRAALAARAA